MASNYASRVMCILCCLSVIISCSSFTNSQEIRLIPSTAKLIEGEVVIFSVNTSEPFSSSFEGCIFAVTSNDEMVFKVKPSEQTVQLSDDKGLVFQVEAVRLGISKLEWTLKRPNSTHVERSGSLPVYVVRPPTYMQIIFTILVTILVSINNINMGCMLDLTVISKVLKKPVAPIIGFCCQFLFMPLVN